MNLSLLKGDLPLAVAVLRQSAFGHNGAWMRRWRQSGCGTGQDDCRAPLLVRCTPASLLTQKNADPDVRGDLDRFFARLLPDGDECFLHCDEGADDMPAHVRAALTAVQLSVSVAGGRLALGTWQGIYLWEHRVRPRPRDVVPLFQGE